MKQGGRKAEKADTGPTLTQDLKNNFLYLSSQKVCVRIISAGFASGDVNYLEVLQWKLS